MLSYLTQAEPLIFRQRRHLKKKKIELMHRTPCELANDCGGTGAHDCGGGSGTPCELAADTGERTTFESASSCVERLFQRQGENLSDSSCTKAFLSKNTSK